MLLKTLVAEEEQAGLTPSVLVKMAVPLKPAAAASRMPSYEAAVAPHESCPYEAARSVQLRPLLLVYKLLNRVLARNMLPSPEMDREVHGPPLPKSMPIDRAQVRAASWLVNNRLIE